MRLTRSFTVIISIMLFKAILLICCIFVSASAKQAVPLIIGGKNAYLGEFPHQVSIQVADYTLRHFCGGAIVNENWVITSAMCVAGVKYDIYVKAGLNWLLSGSYQLRKVSQKIVHEKFPNPPQVGPNDIALLRLERPLTFYEDVQAIALPKQDEPIYNNAVLSGWGVMEPNGQAVSQHLQKIEVPLIQNQVCKSVLERLTNQYAPVVPTNVCTGPVEPGVGACNGDFGGPLIQYENGSAKLVGITSWGMVKCGEQTSITVYTRVSSYINWITSKIHNKCS